MNLGQALKKVREAKGLSQKEVALSCKMDTAQYSRIEGGKTDPSFSLVMRIAKALGVTLTELFNANDPATKTAALRNPFWKPQKGAFKLPGFGEVQVY